MSLVVWIVSYIAVMALWIWIVWWDGAEWIEKSYIAELITPQTAGLDAQVIRGVGIFVIVGATIWFVVGLFVPVARFWW